MLPTRSQRLRFPMRIGGSELEVDIRPDRVTSTLLGSAVVADGDRPDPAGHGCPQSVL